jgi:hypothetical protein
MIEFNAQAPHVTPLTRWHAKRTSALDLDLRRTAVGK